MRPFILVLAGVNGAGKSSVGGAMLAGFGLTWFNPDTCARELVAAMGMSQTEANSRAWKLGCAGLEAAMANGTNYAFETTLGGATITELLAQAAHTHDVAMIFCGLSSPEQHIARVGLRVSAGGHPIPESAIRSRWVSSRGNLVRLLPRLARLQVFDNSAQAELGQDISQPVLLLEMAGGRLVFPQTHDAGALQATPLWARAIVQAAIELQAARED